MRNPVGVESHCQDVSKGRFVVFGIRRVGKQELGSALIAVKFNSGCNGRSKQDAVLAFLSDDERAVG